MRILVDPVLAEIGAKIRTGEGCTVTPAGASGHAANGRVLFVFHTNPHPTHEAGPMTARPLLVVYQTGTDRIIHQLAGDIVKTLIA